MTYTLHRLAEQDLEGAVRYDRKNAGTRVALRLLDEFERVAELLDENPRFYKNAEAGIRILVVRHQRLEPGFGRDRV